MNNKLSENEKRFWKKFKRWHLDDIQRAIDSNAYVGTAKLICCAIDALACFRFGATEYKGSKFRFISFMKEFMPAFKKRLKFYKNRELEYERSVIKMFYENFRSGLIHEGLPGIGTEIIKVNNIDFLYQAPNADKLQINIIGLHSYLKFVFNEYEKELKKNQEFINGFKKRLSHITNENSISKI